MVDKNGAAAKRFTCPEVVGGCAGGSGQQAALPVPALVLIPMNTCASSEKERGEDPKDSDRGGKLV